MGLANKYKEIADKNQSKIEEEINQCRELAKEEYKKVISLIEEKSNNGEYSLTIHTQGKGHKIREGLRLLLEDDGFHINRKQCNFIFISWKY